MDSIVLAMGSNVGDRRRALEMGCTMLERSGVRILQRSRLYISKPWPPASIASSGWYLNAAVSVQTSLNPWELLRRCLAVEHSLGRIRRKKWDARFLDLDLIFYRGVVMNTAELVLPHPRWSRRDFVLAPLLDLKIAPPVSRQVPEFRAALRRLPDNEKCIRSIIKWDN